MRTHFLMTAGLAALTALPQSGAIRWPSNTILKAQICVERPGDTGRLNVRPADVVIESGPIISLMGEQAVCAFVQPGQYRVWAQSRDPNNRQSTNPTAWKSKPIVVKAPANDRVELEVCGIGDATVYNNWKIARAGACRQ
jgi:hypothetical protein